LTLTDAGGGEVTPFIGRITGFIPHWVMCYPFGYQKDLADWYETMNIGSLRLRLHDAAAPQVFASCRVILQQLRRY
ncbi:unnamed protein product, partial [marine sediment metagenome]